MQHQKVFTGYSSKLKERARELRKNMTKHAQKLSSATTLKCCGFQMNI
ncbi:MAG: hypothetical protein K6F91_02350 [Ruminococcus sp.]|nr:hypothetical protein [Ruminococcus sp.]